VVATTVSRAGTGLPSTGRSAVSARRMSSPGNSLTISSGVSSRSGVLRAADAAGQVAAIVADDQQPVARGLRRGGPRALEARPRNRQRYSREQRRRKRLIRHAHTV
jgi:hypothetical protein